MYLDVAECTKLTDEAAGWTKLPPMSTPRAGAFTWTDHINNKIYVAGGISAEGGAPLNSVEILDVATNTWSAGRKFSILTSQF